MALEFSFQEKDFNTIFPFYILINPNMEIASVGKSLEKIIPQLSGKKIDSHFSFTRPAVEKVTRDSLASLTEQLIVLESITNHKTQLRGQLNFLTNTHQYLFIGTPWFHSIEAVLDSGLNLLDFAHHDPMTDLLHLMKTQEITNDDLKVLLQRVNKQKDELKEANKTIHDIALFPTQNPDPLIRINYAGDVIQNNPAAAHLDFIELEKVQYRNDDFFKIIAARIDTTQKRWEIEAKSNNKDISFVCIPMPDEGYINIYGRDITEKKIIETKIGEQKRFYEQILNNIPADIAVFDKTHRYLFLNPMAVKDDELREWLIGKKDEDYITKKSKPISIVTERRAVFNSTLETKKINSWEEKIPQPDGTDKYVLRNMYPVQDNEGNVELVIGYGADITYIKNIQQQIEESEKKYRDVIENSLAIITTHNLEGKFISVNPMASELFGYSEAELINRSISDFLPEQDKLFFESNYLKKIQTGKQLSGTFRVLHKDGHIVYTLFNNFLKEEPGKEPYVIGFAVDISERIKAEKELKLAKKVTEELAQSKQNFLANMSHEIRTPMNAIMGMAAELGKTALNNDQRFFLETIRSASDNLLVIINDILDLSKIEAGKLVLEKIGFQLEQVVKRAMQVMKHKAEEKGLHFTNSFYDTRIANVLIGDPYRINQVILNLLSNAIKFTEKGGVDITCTLSVNSANSQTVRITVSDTGIGMDEEFASKIFHKFSQEDGSIARKYGGTGLGMNICKELVDLMHGKIMVSSKKDNGTAISFELEFIKGTIDHLPQKNTVVTNTQNLRDKKILIADDNKMNRLVASAMLKNYGCQIVHAINGQDAVDKTEIVVPDIILMDVQMPEMDGLEATQKIRAGIHADIPIIALTAFAIKGDQEQFIQAGMNDYLSKPFEEEKLVAIISKWLGDKHDTASGHTSVNPAPIANEKLYNLSKIEEIAQGDTDFIDELMEVFIEQANLSIQQFQTALALGDTARIKAIAHRIKPSIDNMCIQILEEDIHELEHNTDNLYRSGILYERIQHITTVLTSIISQLKK